MALYRSLKELPRPLLLVYAGKLVLLMLFSSEYQDLLFIPFVSHFLSNLDNPWQHFHSVQVDMFPYPPLMLYVQSLSYLPYHLVAGASGGSVLLQNLFFKLPVLGADLVITLVLLRMFPEKVREVTVFYVLSPIILYASYLHSQLDLLPMAVLLLSVYALTDRRVLLAAVLMGLAMSIKFHVVAALPLILVYAFRNFRRSSVLVLAAVPAAIYLACSMPFLLSEGYRAMVLRNPKQMMLFDVTYAIGELRIYLPVFAVFALYVRFSAYARINTDLFTTFLGILFSAFVLLIFPSPAWYVWMVPFLSIFFIGYSSPAATTLPLSLVLNGLYLLYFLFFHHGDHQDLSFLGSAVDLKVNDPKLRNIVFTALEVVLVATIYSLYKFGVRSNAVYRRTRNLIIGIGGDSGSGKSTVLSDLTALLGDKLLFLEGDADHRWERGDEHWQMYTHLHPKANFLHKQAQDLFSLKYGKSISRGDYDHGSGTFTAVRAIEPRDFIVLSGLHPFYLPISRKVIDLKVYLDTADALRCHWKVLRDSGERGYSREQVLAQIEKRADDSKRYIAPQREYADVTITYFSETAFVPGDPAKAPDLKLKITLSSSIHVEQLLKRLDEQRIDVYWDYSDDLTHQYLIIGTPPAAAMVRQIAWDLIPNVHELIAADSRWQEGYRGFVQLVLLLVVSEMIREEGGERDG